MSEFLGHLHQSFNAPHALPLPIDERITRALQSALGRFKPSLGQAAHDLVDHFSAPSTDPTFSYALFKFLEESLSTPPKKSIPNKNSPTVHDIGVASGLLALMSLTNSLSTTPLNPAPILTGKNWPATLDQFLLATMDRVTKSDETRSTKKTKWFEQILSDIKSIPSAPSVSPSPFFTQGQIPWVLSAASLVPSGQIDPDQLQKSLTAAQNNSMIAARKKMPPPRGSVNFTLLILDRHIQNQAVVNMIVENALVIEKLLGKTGKEKQHWDSSLDVLISAFDDLHSRDFNKKHDRCLTPDEEKGWQEAFVHAIDIEKDKNSAGSDFSSLVIKKVLNFDRVNLRGAPPHLTSDDFFKSCIKLWFNCNPPTEDLIDTLLFRPLRFDEKNDPVLAQCIKNELHASHRLKDLEVILGKALKNKHQETVSELSKILPPQSVSRAVDVFLSDQLKAFPEIKTIYFAQKSKEEMQRAVGEIQNHEPPSLTKPKKI